MEVKAHQGFTLIELIAVIIVVSIIAVVAIPRMATSNDANAAAQRLVADLRFTQSLALTHGIRYRLTLGHGVYKISTASGILVKDLVGGQGEVALPAGTSFGTISNLPEDIIGFDGLGRPYQDTTATTPLAATATIDITSGGVTRTVTIDTNGTISGG